MSFWHIEFYSNSKKCDLYYLYKIMSISWIYGWNTLSNGIKFPWTTEYLHVDSPDWIKFGISQSTTTWDCWCEFGKLKPMGNRAKLGFRINVIQKTMKWQQIFRVLVILDERTSNTHTQKKTDMKGSILLISFTFLVLWSATHFNLCVDALATRRCLYGMRLWRHVYVSPFMRLLSINFQRISSQLIRFLSIVRFNRRYFHPCPHIPGDIHNIYRFLHVALYY